LRAPHRPIQAAAAELKSARLSLIRLSYMAVIRTLAIPRVPSDGSLGTESGIEGA